MNRSGKKAELTEEWLISKLDETDKDTKELKNEIKVLYDSWRVKANEIGEISAIGANVIKLLDLKDKNLDKKLKLVSQLWTILESKSKNSKPVENEDNNDIDNYSVPDNLKNELDRLINKK